MNSCCENMPFLVLWRTVTLQNDTQTDNTYYELLMPKMLSRITPKTNFEAALLFLVGRVCFMNYFFSSFS